MSFSLSAFGLHQDNWLVDGFYNDQPFVHTFCTLFKFRILKVVSSALGAAAKLNMDNPNGNTTIAHHNKHI